jgi:hypothetical protein
VSGANGGYLLWVAALAAALWWPVSRLVWVLSVRRLERRLDRKLDEAEIAGQKRRAWLIAVVLSLIFSALFNLRLIERGG